MEDYTEDIFAEQTYQLPTVVTPESSGGSMTKYLYTALSIFSIYIIACIYYEMTESGRFGRRELQYYVTHAQELAKTYSAGHIKP